MGEIVPRTDVPGRHGVIVDWINLYPWVDSIGVFWSYHHTNPETDRCTIAMHPGKKSEGWCRQLSL